MFIRETHGIHIGTGKDHVKHGIDDITEIVELAILRNHPSITFIIHSPRLTRFRYDSEKSTDIKFIRGDNAYFQYPQLINELKLKYNSQIEIIYGVELEWLGSGLGLLWNRSKVFQAGNPDFIIGSVHFSKEGIPYDGSEAEAKKLLELRGSLENYWDGYLLEIMEMIDTSHDLIQVIGHLDLPKLNMAVPDPLINVDSSSHFLARRMRTLLELISEYNLALDVNLAGIMKGCGIYPAENILRRANSLRIPVTIGTDTHKISDYGKNYDEGINYLKTIGYKHYVHFSSTIPSKKPLEEIDGQSKKYETLNLAIELLNNRFGIRNRNLIPHLSFGGKYKSLLQNFDDSTNIGNFNAIRVRKGNKSLTVSDTTEITEVKSRKLLYSKHLDKPGILSTLFNTLASEEINVNTAQLKANTDGTAEAWLDLSGDEKMIQNAIEFILGTASDRFLNVEYSEQKLSPGINNAGRYLIEVDGVDLPMPISKKMILSIHNDAPGVLLVLLSALASNNINIIDLQLGRRGSKGYAILGFDGNPNVIEKLIPDLGKEFTEVSVFEIKKMD